MSSADGRALKRHGWWWRTLAGGSALWLIAVTVTAFTQDRTLMPTVIFLGGFLVPFCVVQFVAERITGGITVAHLVFAFVVGGVCGVLAASLLEGSLTDNLLVYVGVGFIEEAVKGVILVVAGWRAAPKTAQLGAMLGATVGAGFAAFESTGYAYNAALSSPGLGLYEVLQTESVRALLTPVGHVLWTAILGAAVFRATQEQSWLRRLALVAAAYAGASLLHAAWNSMGGIAQILGMLVTGNGWHVQRYAYYLAHAPHRVHAEAVASVLYPAGLVVISFVGLLSLWLIARERARRSGPLSALTPVRAA